MIGSFTQILSDAKFEFDAIDIADILWLAQFVQEPSSQPSPQNQQTQESDDQPEIDQGETDPNQGAGEAALNLYSTQMPTLAEHQPSSTGIERAKPQGVPFAVPASPAIRTRLDLARALRPLMRKVPSLRQWELDEDATVTEIAETNVWNPVVRPVKERWLELDLVVEESKTTAIWERVIEDLNQVVQYQGAFRAIRTWRLSAESGRLQIFSRWRDRQDIASSDRSRISGSPKSPRELIDKTGRRLIWFVTDCTSPLWQQRQIYDCLGMWSQGQPVAVFQLFPERFWSRTALRRGHMVRLWSHPVGTKAQRFEVEGVPRRLQRRHGHDLVTVPIMSLEVESVHRWSRVLSGAGETFTPGRTFHISSIEEHSSSSVRASDSASMTAYERVALFRATSSATAMTLANLMAAAPVSLPVIDLLRETFRDQFQEEVLQSHVAEVLLSCLLHRSDQDDSEHCQYVFWGDESFNSEERVRDILLGDASMQTTLNVLDEVSACICRKLGCPVRSFEALLSDIQDFESELRNTALPFARVGIDVLRRLGGNYEVLAERYVQTVIFPPLKTFKFREAIVSFEADRLSRSPLPSQLIEFETATIRFEITINARFASKSTELNVLQRIVNDENRHLVNGILSESISDDQVSQLLAIIPNLRSEEDQSDLICCIAPYISYELMPEVLQAAHGIRSKFFRSVALSRLIQYLSPDPPEVFESAMSMLNENDKSVELSRIYDHIPERLFYEIIDLINSIDNEFEAGFLLAQLSHSLQCVELDPDIESEVLSIARSFENLSARAQALGMIAPQLPPTQRREVLKQARTSAQKIEDETERSEVLKQLSGEWVITRRRAEIQQSLESLDQDLTLALVRIPAGVFIMGSPDNDSESFPSVVTFDQPFLMSQTPITQAQWRFVAELPQADRELEPAPSNFKGDNRPVEKINWYDAVEFCARLSQFTGREYRLPSEAEWEYACRAGTQTPFHFGETLSPELANYLATQAFEDGPTGEWREETTEVGSFPANAFGLYDMHGNVREWCQDNWHENIREAPTDGRAWGDKPDSRHVLRGGSWYSFPEFCRSANRFGDFPDNWVNYVGLRVVCGIART